MQPTREMEQTDRVEVAMADAAGSKHNKMELVPVLFKHKNHLSCRKVTPCLCRSSGCAVLNNIL